MGLIEPHGIANFACKAAALEIAKCQRGVFRSQKNVQILGPSAYSGMFLKRESARHCKWYPLLLKGEQDLPKKRFLLLRKFGRLR